MKNKSFTYLLKLNQEIENTFESFNKKLGWNKKETILKSVQILKELIVELGSGRKLVIQVQDEKTGNVVKEKVASYELLRTPE